MSKNIYAQEKTSDQYLNICFDILMIFFIGFAWLATIFLKNKLEKGFGLQKP